MIPPIGSTPLPVAPADSVPSIAPVAPVSPVTPSQKAKSDSGGDRGRDDPPTYGRSGLRTCSRKGRLVDRDA